MRMDDPTATYRGYRRQTLYALFRLFEDALAEDYIIQPEGNEDLAIFDSAGSLVEIVQVKDHSDNLAASSFKPSFYDRIAPYCTTGSYITVRIASFGPIGPDLQNAASGDADAQSRILKTLTKSRSKEQKLSDGTTTIHTSLGLSEVEAKNIVNHITLTSVDEDVLTDAIVAALAKSITSVDAQHAFDFLMWWLLTSSEAQLRIDRSKAIAKVGNIGKFLSQRAAYHDEWYSSIIPIAPTAAAVTMPSLEEEFYRGGRVRFDHINLDLDISRDRFLKEIHDAFSRFNVVIVHSASGQGKTTLAYRYAKEFAPADFRLEVLASSNLKHARRLALALVGHADAIEVPTLVFIDVRPGDNYWTEVVRELASVVGIRVLVTIREEDWTRARITAADFSFAEVELYFEKGEAEPIYRRLTAQAGRPRHLDFEEAWSQFGTRKTLFEFVYYVTQQESLADRISSQIKGLQDAVLCGDRGAGELELLRLVAVASAYEARLVPTKLLACCDLADPQRTIERFSDEYLIRVSEDGCHIEGFHSIRSEIISNKLTDPIALPWADVASRTLPLIVEEDLQGFLLSAFSRKPNASESLIASLDTFRPTTCVGIHGVATSLMWNGIRTYTEANAAILDEVASKVDSGWYFTLDWDLGQVCGKGGFQVLERLKHFAEDAAEYARSVRAKQTDKDLVFSHVRRWLEDFTELPAPPNGIPDFSALGELSFWIGHLQADSLLRDAINGDVFDKAIKELPLYLFGEFVRGIRTSHCEVYDEWFRTHRDELVKYLRLEAAIATFDETDHAVIAHFAIDLDRQSSALRSRGEVQTAAIATIHDLTIERVELLSNLFSGKKRYGAVGYGHRTSLVAKVWDDADKPGVLAEKLHATWAPRFNAVARGYAELRFRPANWPDYFGRLQSMRERVLSTFADLRQAVSSLSRVPPLAGTAALKDPSAWDECRQEVNKQLLVPRIAVDEWGFITESSTGRTTEARGERYSGLRRFDPVRQAVNDYTRTVGNFMSQALSSLVLIPHLKAAESQFAKDTLLAAASKLGFSEHSIRLSVVNGVDGCAAVDQLQRATQAVFENDPLPGADLEFCERERRDFVSTITAWCTFVDRGTCRQASGTSSTKSRPQKLRSSKAVGFADLLIQTRNRVESSLREVRKKGIQAQILSESVLWDNSPALWISCDTAHPIASLKAIETMWHQLVAAFRPDCQKIVKVKVIDLMWSSIIIVPLVGGKSLERQAIPQFKGVTYAEPPDLLLSPWRLFPTEIPDDVWSQLGLDHWEVQPNWIEFDRFAAAYGLLFQHVDHMADFDRLPGDLDELGLSVLQSYLDHEAGRAQPLLQDLFDSCAILLTSLPEIDEQVIELRPNICLCIHFLVEMKEAIMPTPDYQQRAKLSIEQVVDWRDRLSAGIKQLGVARYLWIADSLNFGAWCDS